MDRKLVGIVNDPALLDLETLDLTQHKLVFDGPLKLNLSKHQTVDMHVLLFEDILVFLEKQEDRFILKDHNMDAQSELDDTCTYYPVLKLHNLLATTLPSDEKLFFVVNISELEAQWYELTAASEELGNKWCKLINDTVEKFKQSLTHTVGIVSKGQGINTILVEHNTMATKADIFKVTDLLQQNLEMMDDFISQEELILTEVLHNNGEKILAALEEQAHLLTSLVTLNAATSKVYSASRDDEDDNDDNLRIKFLLAKAKEIYGLCMKRIASSAVYAQHQVEQGSPSYSFNIPVCSPAHLDNTNIADIPTMTIEQHTSTVSSNVSSLHNQKMNILPEYESPSSNRSCPTVEDKKHMHCGLHHAAVTQLEKSIESLSMSSGPSTILFQ